MVTRRQVPAVTRGVAAPGRLYVMRADGHGTAEDFAPEAFIEGLSWSPDGTRIALGPSSDDRGGSIVVIGRDGRSQRYVTDGRVELAPHAQPGDWADDRIRLVARRHANRLHQGRLHLWPQ
jgi:hypothetical protein